MYQSKGVSRFTAGTVFKPHWVSNQMGNGCTLIVNFDSPVFFVAENSSIVICRSALFLFWQLLSQYQVPDKYFLLSAIYSFLDFSNSNNSVVETLWPEQNRFVSRDTATLDANEQILGGLSESFTWKLDGVSNWKENTTPQGAENRTVNELNQIVGGAFTHDADGNRLSDANRNYVYDANSRLLEVWNADNTVQLEAYTYDTLNRRVTRRTGTGTPQEKTIRYVYDGAHAIEERVGNVVEAYNYYGEELDSLIARETVGNGLTWHHRDVVGSTTAITNQSGAAVEHYEYSPFGETLFLDASFQTVMDQGSPIKESARNNPFLFLGRRLDATGLHYFRDRFYDALEGRFLGRDSNQDSLNVGNLYTYASNNPFNYIDPWGMSGQASNHAAYLKQLRKHSKAFAWGATKGVFSGILDAINPFSIIGDLKAGIEFAGEVFTNPRKLLERFICMLKQLSSEEAAELLGEMLGGSLVDGAIGLLISALTGGAAAPLAAAKLVGRLLKVMKRGGKLIKKLIKKGRGVVRKVKCKLKGNACFLAGTKVLTKHGRKNIEDVKMGDEVLSRCDKTGKQGFKKVIRLFRGRTKKVVHLKFRKVKRPRKARTEHHSVGQKAKKKSSEGEEDGEGDGDPTKRSDPDLDSEQTILCTEEHPFWVEGQGWVKAKDLRLGDKLHGSNRDALEVSEHEIKDEEVAHFNFEVQNFHTYFVADGKYDDAPGIWVHNTCWHGYTEFRNKFPSHQIGPPDLFDVEDVLKSGKAAKGNYVVLGDGTLVLGRRFDVHHGNLGGGHIDLAQGKSVLAAGEFKIYGGKIKKLNNDSSHYLPIGDSAQNAAIRAFEEAGFTGAIKKYKATHTKIPLYPDRLNLFNGKRT